MRFLVRFLVACLLCVTAYSQVPNLDPKHPVIPNLDPKHPKDKLLPTISYEFVVPGETSPHYVISVDSSGNAAYRSWELLSEQQIGTKPDIVKFTVDQPTCMRLFQLARQANYFEHGSAPAMATLDPTFSTTNTVFNTLTYAYGPVYSFDKAFRSIRTSLTYSSTNDAAIQQLTAIFGSIYRALQQGPPTQPINVAP